MSRALIGLLVLGFVGSSAAQEALRNEDVLRLSKSGLPEALIIKMIRTSPTRFVLSLPAVIALQKAGVSPRVIEAMAATATKRPAAPNARIAAAERARREAE